MGAEPTRAIYVRMPDRLARKLDNAAERLGITKRDLMAMLVNDHLDASGDHLVLRPASGSTHDVEPSSGSEVLTLEEATVMLKAEPSDVERLIEAAGLPARRVGSGWRLSRAAVLDWLSGGGNPLGQHSV